MNQVAVFIQFSAVLELGLGPSGAVLPHGTDDDGSQGHLQSRPRRSSPLRSSPWRASRPTTVLQERQLGQHRFGEHRVQGSHSHSFTSSTVGSKLPCFRISRPREQPEFGHDVRRALRPASRQRSSIESPRASPGGGFRAVILADGPPLNLGTLGDHSTSGSEGVDINDAGWVVGDSDSRAFLFDGVEMLDLNTLIRGRNPFTRLAAAQSINNRGDIVGVGWLNAEYTHSSLEGFADALEKWVILHNLTPT